MYVKAILIQSVCSVELVTAYMYVKIRKSNENISQYHTSVMKTKLSFFL